MAFTLSRTTLSAAVFAAALSVSGLAQAQGAHVVPAAQPHAQPVHPHKPHHPAKPQSHHKQEHKKNHPKVPHAAPAGHANLSVYEQNALRRCAVFKTDWERDACVSRVRNAPISGSVQGGGVLRESVIQVPMHTQPGHSVQPMPHPHVKP